MSNPAETFAQEAEDLLQTLEQRLLELEAAPGDAGLVDAVFRALHTLKGSGDMFGYVSLAAFVHHLETAFDRVREGRAAVSRDLIEAALDSRDHLAELVAAGPDHAAAAKPAEGASAKALLARVSALAEASEELAGAEAQPSRPTAALKRFRIRFKPAPSSFRTGFRPDLLLTELAALGHLKAACITEDVPPLESLDPAECHLAWRMELDGRVDRELIDDVFIFLQDGDIRIEEETLEEVADAEAVSPSVPQPENAPVTDRAEAQVAAPRTDSVRVQAHRLDALMDQLGELVIAQARLERISNELRHAELESVAEEIERLVTGLRDATLSIRMLPISLVFGKFRRVVRDLSSELGKQVVLETLGGETEVDKNVIDSLTEPLVHMIRNAVDHGVEAPEARAAAGKPAQAKVLMRARQSGGEVLISVADDGAGLSAPRIRKRAVERGLIAADAEMSDEALYQLIFEPGFSTAETLSSVSGRGVGMDAVRRVIDDLRGSVEVRSQPGQGTEVTLRLPLTLAIIDGLLVRVGGGFFVVPLSSVEECVELPAAENARESGRSILRIRDELVPFLSLDALFGFERSAAPGRRVVIASVDGRRTGLVVDDVVGQHQTVIKSLSLYHRDVEGLAGGTILGDGSVALILDPAALVKRAQASLRLVA